MAHLHKGSVRDFILKYNSKVQAEQIRDALAASPDRIRAKPDYQATYFYRCHQEPEA